MTDTVYERRKLTPPAEVTTPSALLEWARREGVQEIDVKFTDIRGQWQHFSMPLVSVDESIFSEGIGFDGSSIRGFQEIHESDMNLLPVIGTAFIDPVPVSRTLSLICDVYDVSGTRYTRDPRGVAERAEAYLRQSGIADVANFGPEAEFFIFTSARWGEGMNTSFYEIDSDEGPWNTGKNGGAQNLAYRPRAKEGYFPAPPMDKLHDVRSAMVATLMSVGIDVEVHHHEVGAAGQAEIDMRFSSMLKMADNLQVYKYIIKNVARQHGYTVTFMPKPLFKDNGSGMHCHQSLWKHGANLFFDKDGYALLSKTALHYIGGILKHARSLMAFCAPSTNSYRRLVPGYEAPVNLVYSARNRSAAIRIPMYSSSPKAKRIEFRAPDPTANPYLAFAAMLMAGLDGIENEIDPGKPADYDLYVGNGRKTPVAPGSLHESLEALLKDYNYLLKGGVFTRDLIEKYYEYKRYYEADAVAMRPHPHEFDLYFDA